jgi:hypothetical protein
MEIEVDFDKESNSYRGVAFWKNDEGPEVQFEFPKGHPGFHVIEELFFRCTSESIEKKISEASL